MPYNLTLIYQKYIHEHHQIGARDTSNGVWRDSSTARRFGSIYKIIQLFVKWAKSRFYQSYFRKLQTTGVRVKSFFSLVVGSYLVGIQSRIQL